MSQPLAPGVRRLRQLAPVLTVIATFVALFTITAPGTPAHGATAHSKPTVVLVHGAWADSGSWDGVTTRLQHDGYTVRAFPTPLQGLASDAAVLKDFLGTIHGPVVLVGHSYGGAVISEAATGLSQVRSLVYLDAFAPAAGEPIAPLAGSDSVLANPDPTKVFTFSPAGPPSPTSQLYVQDGLFVKAFANDLPRAQARALAAEQRPIAYGALIEPATTPAWASIPSWYEVGTLDKVIPPAAQRAMAHRAHAHIVTARTGHLPMVSQPARVARTIEAAAGRH